ncbi:helix-turn-helix domain-containing protein [Pseudarthrobacter sp. P1]|uniref:helix-turn-helix domain-containing protein n=1 Tax=Pseudarthrobacter sp. P1 TaxID=3418418 RepID=UPI003CF57AE4
MHKATTTTSPQVGQRVKHRATGEMGTVTGVETIPRGTYVHVTWDDPEALEMPSSLRVEFVILMDELLNTAGPYSYYDATLAKIRAVIAGSPLTYKAVAAGVGMSDSTLRRRLSGEGTLMVSDIAALAEVLGCRMSALVA